MSEVARGFFAMDSRIRERGVSSILETSNVAAHGAPRPVNFRSARRDLCK